MKCQNCGNNEVNFRYSSNINGNVTEALLCSDCARKLGYLNDETFSFAMPSLSGMVSDFFGDSVFSGFPGLSSGFRMPPFQGFAALPMYFEPVSPKYSEPSAPEKSAVPAQGVDIEAGDDIKKRRELNMLREQMKKAAEEENFEKAAELRDEIKKFESEK